jgi:two-component system, OmpR family, alkaline phosphatase synthesis response regulator PhoP
MEENIKILIVEDEQDISEILQFNLSGEGFMVEVAASGEEALKKDLASFDLFLLDVMLGGMSGYKLANIIRKELDIATPIVFLTAKGAENDVLTGFNVGADDYIQKPFSIREVIARIKAILKRGANVSDDQKIITFSDLSVDHKKKTVTISGESIDLTRKEFEILVLLMKKPGQYLGREEILTRIWSNDVIVTERNVDVNIARLRKKLGSYGVYIKGKSGFGYSFGK